MGKQSFISKALTIISIIGGVASILSIINSIVKANQINVFEIIGFSVCALLIAYVLFYPNNKLVRNVYSKIRKYDINSTPTYVDQTGIFEIAGLNQVSIEFPIPFVTNPQIEILNHKGNRGSIPEILKVTIYQVTVGRTFSGPGEVQEFKWIARGEVITPSSLFDA